MSDEIEVRFRMSRDHFIAMQRALELEARLGMGQFYQIAESVDFEFQPDSTWWDRHESLDLACRNILIPDLPARCYRSMHSNKTPLVSKLAWELFAACRKLDVMPVSEQPMPSCEVIDV